MTRLLQSPSQRSVFFMLLSLLFFAANVLLLRGLAIHVPGADGWAGILFRGAVGLGLLLALFGGSRGLDLRTIFTRRKMAARGIVGALSTLLFYITIVHLGASRAIVINLTYPLFGVIIASFWLKESLTMRVGFWILAGFAGLVLFFSDGAFARGLSAYDLVAVLSAAGSGVAVVLIRGLSSSHHPSTIYGSQCVFAILLTVPVAGPAIFSSNMSSTHRWAAST
jgi:drug/metabolite transporter (DMT)-like permease